MITGKGDEWWGRGVHYKGAYLKNMRHGKGVCTWKDGTVYEGTWEDNQANGYGVLTMPDGYKYIGIFKNNKFVQKISLKSNASARHTLQLPQKSQSDYGRAWLLNSKAQSFKVYSRRPMMNKIMNALNSGADQPHAMSSISFKHKNLGVNASAYNYSFAADRT